MNHRQHPRKQAVPPILAQKSPFFSRAGGKHHTTIGDRRTRAENHWNLEIDGH
ncbi:hypothetical protein [Oxynema aestuarii]|uniref:Uncharacterized protein n=1 Tax=Oxynema aestuarii AP17 TaxID=2064643 RepID=A0A6H1TVH0_9CYAN|nr:hypothetical protein [Oxynema aestuarii]QIZ70127.1 hypothetical protein HCG48_05700 [Oxynema aestuarii AP17]